MNKLNLSQIQVENIVTNSGIRVDKNNIKLIRNRFKSRIKLGKYDLNYFKKRKKLESIIKFNQ